MNVAANRLPWMKWYSKDALGDPALRACMPESRGVWYDMLWLMDVSPNRGYLLKNNAEPFEDRELCRVLALMPDELQRSREDLIKSGVASVDDNGVWFNRRMVRDEQRRIAGSIAGRKGGGNPVFQNPELRDQNLEVRSHIPEARTPIKDTYIGEDKGDLIVGFIDEPSNSKFITPTVEQVRAYCEQRNNGIDPEAFVNFYESKGWMIGKNKMKKWQAAVVNWEKMRSAALTPGRETPSHNADGTPKTLDQQMDDIARQSVGGLGCKERR